MALEEIECIKKDELTMKIKDELLILSTKFNLISDYLSHLKEYIIKESIAQENIIEENINNNDGIKVDKKNFLKNKRFLNDINNNDKYKINENKSKYKKIEDSKKSNKSKSYPKEKVIHIKKSSSKLKSNSRKEKLFDKNKKKRKYNLEKDENNEENEDDDEEEYINYEEEENSNSSELEKKVNKKQKHKKKKLKSIKSGVMSKLYAVKIKQNESISSGYRVYFKCKGINMCFGPYTDFNFAYDFRKLMLSQLKMFTGDIPNVSQKIEEFFKRTKEAVDKKQAPVEMVKKYKYN